MVMFAIITMAWALSFSGVTISDQTGRVTSGWSGGYGDSYGSLSECVEAAKLIYETGRPFSLSAKCECKNLKPKKPLPDWYGKMGGSLNPDEYWEIHRFDYNKIMQFKTGGK